jgi:hypothetical protein
VQIDDRQNKVRKLPWRTEFDRPIYFVELRDGYACSWCELVDKKLTLIPHPLSPCGIRQFDFPTEAEVIGRVTLLLCGLLTSRAPTDAKIAKAILTLETNTLTKSESASAGTATR